MGRSSLTLASLNTYGIPMLQPHLVRRYIKIAQYFNNSDVDIIQLQELCTYPQFFFLKNLLKKFPYCSYTKSFLGPKGGLATFSRMQFNNASYKSFRERMLPFDKSMAEMLVLKGMLITTIDSLNLTLINTHFNCNFEWNWSKNNRYSKLQDSQIDDFHKLVKSIASKRNNIVASGDFNIARESIFYERLLAGSGIIDPFASYNTATYHEEYPPKNLKTKRIDYIFLAGHKSVRVLKTKEIFTEKVFLTDTLLGYVSDHTGLEVNLELSL